MPTSTPGIIDALYRISALVSRTEEPREALGVILDEVTRLLDCSTAQVAMVHPDTRHLVVEATRGVTLLPEAAPWRKLGEGVAGWVALHGKALLVNDHQGDQRLLPPDPAIRSEMAVPMDDQGNVIGVVWVTSQSATAFGETEQKILTLLTAEATRVVSRLWLIRQLRFKAAQQEMLLAATSEIVASRDPVPLYRTLAHHARDVLPAHAAAVFTVENDGDSLQLQALVGPEGLVETAATLPLGETTVATTIQRLKQVEVFEIARTEAPHFADEFGEDGLVSLLATPILVGDEVVGVLNVYSSFPRRFTNEEKRLVATLASVGAVALDNARLYHRVFTSEETLRRNERLTTLGLLAAEIAHEIRNPLTVIKLLFETLDLQYPAGDVRREDVAVIAEKLRQLEAIVSRVLSFGKSQDSVHGRLNLESLVRETLHLVRLKLQQAGITLEYRVEPGTYLVEGSKTQLAQACLNVLLNATEAMAEGGLIRVRLARVQKGEQQWATLDLRDTGPGIPPELRDRLFESFLTGRADGTGLGLSISRRILKQHRGEIEVTETGPGGTNFRLWLPLGPGR